MSVPKAPKISGKAYVDRTASVIGDVTVGDDVYIAPHVSIRADEPGSSIVLGDQCNVQDNVVIHALKGSAVKVGTGSTLAHGCIVHGPCTIGDGCFVGFGAVVFKCTMMDGAVVMHRAAVTHTLVPSSRLVRTGEVIDGGVAPADLPEVTEDLSEFVSSVRRTNVELARMYSRQGCPASEG